MTCFSWQICKILGQFTVQQGGVLINGQWVIDFLLNRFAAFFSLSLECMKKEKERLRTGIAKNGFKTI